MSSSFHGVAALFARGCGKVIVISFEFFVGVDIALLIPLSPMCGVGLYT